MPKVMKRVASLTLGAAMIISTGLFSACGNTNNSAASSAASTSQAAATAQATSAVAPDAPTFYGLQLKDLSQGGTLKGQYKGKKIVVATKASFEDSLKDEAKYFKEYSGADVEVQFFPDNNFTEKIQLDLNSTHLFDAVVMPVAFIHGYAQGGLVQDLTPYVNNKQLASPNFDINDFIPSLLNIYGKFGGKLVAFPYKPDSQIFFYRKDLFGDPKQQAAFKAKTGKDLKVPQTPDEMLETAKFFTKSINPDSPVDYGYSTMASKSNSRFIWDNRLAAFGGKDVDENFNPAFNNDAGLKAMNFALELQKYAPKQWLQFGWDEANNFFVQGNAAMMEQWPFLGVLSESDSSKVKGKVGYAVTPGGAPTLGGWAIAMTSSTKEPDVAYKFMEFCTSKDGELIKASTKQQSMDFTRTSNFSRPEIQASNKMYPVLMESLSKAKILADPDVPYLSSKLDDIEELGVQDVLSGKAKPEDALKTMADSFAKETKAVGLTK
ncbi:MAG TPA: sugar ABC transporter substrate-binding protein [Ruminiclostridium sp.]|nr:sugar ABC transporter substrate-binding protein [Ruminiclostridium sp.]